MPRSILFRAAPLGALILILAPQPARSGAGHERGNDPPLTAATLKTTLDDLEYKVIKTQKDKAGKVVGYLIEVEHDGQTFRPGVILTGNGSFVRVFLWLKPPAKGSKVPAEVYRKMLEKNFTDGPPFFTVD